jgi:hypothetical protein
MSVTETVVVGTPTEIRRCSARSRSGMRWQTLNTPLRLIASLKHCDETVPTGT